MFYAGLLFDVKFLGKVLHREPLTHLAALSCVNFFLVPLIGFFIIESLSINGALAIAIMTIAVFPCAPVVPSIVGSLEGDSSWAILVLVLFTLLSLPATIVYYLSSGDLHNGGITSSPILGLCRYLLVVYPPIIAGIICNKLFSTERQRIVKYAKIVMNFSLLSVVLIFSVLHFNELLTVSLTDIACLLLFIILSALGVLLVGKSELGNFSTSLFSTVMRNIALAISFCTLVLQRSDVSMYLFLYIVVAGIFCSSLSLLRKRYVRYA
jgi:predicted Na+-dependent transporter